MLEKYRPHWDKIVSTILFRQAAQMGARPESMPAEDPLWKALALAGKRMDAKLEEEGLPLQARQELMKKLLQEALKAHA